MADQIFVNEQAAAAQRDWEATADDWELQPIQPLENMEPTTDRRPLREIIADYKRARLLAWLLGIVE